MQFKLMICLVIFGIAVKEIRHRFFSANQSKMVICVSASAAGQHIEAPINTNNNLPDS